MADPVSASVIAKTAMSSAGQVFTGIQGYYEGRSVKEQLDTEAARVDKESQWAANRIRARARRLASGQRARFAAAGVDLSGSAVDVQADSAWQSEVDAMTTIYKGNVTSAALRTQGKAAKKSGTMGLLTSSMSASGSILGGMGQYFSLQSGINPSFTGDK